MRLPEVWMKSNWESQTSHLWGKIYFKRGCVLLSCCFMPLFHHGSVNLCDQKSSNNEARSYLSLGWIRCGLCPSTHCSYICGTKCCHRWPQVDRWEVQPSLEGEFPKITSSVLNMLYSRLYLNSYTTHLSSLSIFSSTILSSSPPQPSGETPTMTPSHSSVIQKSNMDA